MMTPKENFLELLKPNGQSATDSSCDCHSTDLAIRAFSYLCGIGGDFRWISVYSVVEK